MSTARSPVETLLVVEDDKTLRDVIVKTIKDAYPHFRLETAADGAEALDKISQQIPTILITNVMMPRMTGIELLTALHRKGIVLPTIVTSGYYKHETFEEWLSDEQIPGKEKFLFLEKPFRFAQVKRWIGEILKSNREGGAAMGGQTTDSLDREFKAHKYIQGFLVSVGIVVSIGLVIFGLVYLMEMIDCGFLVAGLIGLAKLFVVLIFTVIAWCVKDRVTDSFEEWDKSLLRKRGDAELSRGFWLRVEDNERRRRMRFGLKN